MKRVYGTRKSVMVSEEEDDTTAVKCRERRRRRMAMRRMAAGAASCSSSVVGRRGEEELMRVKVIGDESNSGELWRTAINRCFERMDEMALRLCLCGGLGTSSNICRCNPQLSFMGSTAVVSVLTKENIFVANCGDSRAVLCRNGRPIPLSLDHKPDREDERRRIEGCGGRIMFADGARVEGILAMSRAIGTHHTVSINECRNMGQSPINSSDVLNAEKTNVPTFLCVFV
nr:probable protein phosphatase 2C 75 [Tanacetum cinerariifolium]